MSKKCAICGNEVNDIEPKIIMTGKSNLRYKLGKGVHSQYTDFQAHEFFVCTKCSNKRMVLIIISVLVLLAILILGDRVSSRSAIGVVFYVLLLASIAVLFFGRITAKIKKLAIKDRKINEPDKYKAFTMSKFEKLEYVKKN